MGKDPVTKAIGDAGKGLYNVAEGVPRAIFTDTEETKFIPANRAPGFPQRQQAPTPETGPRPEQPTIGPAPMERSPGERMPTDVSLGGNSGPYSGTYYMGRTQRHPQQQVPHMQAAVNSLRFG